MKYIKYWFFALVLYVVPAFAVIEHEDGSVTFNKEQFEWLVQMYKENQELKIQNGDLKKALTAEKSKKCI